MGDGRWRWWMVTGVLYGDACTVRYRHESLYRLLYTPDDNPSAHATSTARRAHGIHRRPRGGERKRHALQTRSLDLLIEDARSKQIKGKTVA